MMAARSCGDRSINAETMACSRGVSCFSSARRARIESLDSSSMEPAPVRSHVSLTPNSRQIEVMVWSVVPFSPRSTLLRPDFVMPMRRPNSSRVSLKYWRTSFMRLFNVFTSFSKVSIEQKVSKVNLNLQNSVDKVSRRCYYGGMRCRTDTKKITRIHLRHTREVMRRGGNDRENESPRQRLHREVREPRADV
nr:MAG TPA: hypothetical protein [Bacteriophage sp.]